ncbi:MAG: hypothetical protein GY801_29890 [bacterium]|nr:hypothetical protein [bacterium]
MATLLLKKLNEQLVSKYETASEDEKSQVNKVIEDILCLWTQQRSESSHDDPLWHEMYECIKHPQTFALDWTHMKLSREEMNER